MLPACQPLRECHGPANAGFGLLRLVYQPGHGAAVRAAVAVECGFGLGPGGKCFGQLVGYVHVVGVRVGRDGNCQLVAQRDAYLLAHVLVQHQVAAPAFERQQPQPQYVPANGDEYALHRLAAQGGQHPGRHHKGLRGHEAGAARFQYGAEGKRQNHGRE